MSKAIREIYRKGRQQLKKISKANELARIKCELERLSKDPKCAELEQKMLDIAERVKQEGIS